MPTQPSNSIQTILTFLLWNLSREKLALSLWGSSSTGRGHCSPNSLQKKLKLETVPCPGLLEIPDVAKRTLAHIYCTQMKMKQGSPYEFNSSRGKKTDVMTTSGLSAHWVIFHSSTRWYLFLNDSSAAHGGSCKLLFWKLSLERHCEKNFWWIELKIDK